MDFKQYLTEEKLNIDTSEDTVPAEYYVNPTTLEWRDILRRVKTTRADQIRGCINSNGDVYIWVGQGFEVLHMTAKNSLDQNGIKITNNIIGVDGGAIPQFFATWSNPGMMIASNPLQDPFEFGFNEIIEPNDIESLSPKALEVLNKLHDMAKKKNPRLTFAKRVIV